MQMAEQWMIYGANGYTGRLVAELAVARGHRPVLAGRRAAPVAALADQLGLEHRCVDLADTAGLREALAEVALVAHCAGPFSVTADPMVSACLATGTHYLDITGEAAVFEAVFDRHAHAIDAGVVLVPGVGFDVVPTDCLAVLLAADLPGATSLELAFLVGGGVSRGTARTALTTAATSGGRARRRVGGALRPTAFGRPHRIVPFPSGPRRVGAVTWGDLVTAYRSTGIGDITVYTRLPGTGRFSPVPTSALAHLMRIGGVRRLAERALRRRRPGPSARTRAATGVQVWGQVRDPTGEHRTATLVGPNAYDLTADAVVTAAGRLLAGSTAHVPVPPGAHTPATAFGAGFVAELHGVLLSGPGLAQRPSHHEGH